MDTHEAADWLDTRVETLKQRTDSSPLHAELDALADDFRATFAASEKPAETTPTEGAPHPRPA